MFLDRYQLKSDYAFKVCIIPLFEANVDDHGFLLFPSFFYSILSRQITPSISGKKNFLVRYFIWKGT